MRFWLRMKHNAFETLLGAAILAVAAFFVVQTYKSTGQSSKDGYYVVAYFDRIDGVMVGTDVKVSGVKVGSIAGVSMEPDTYRAKVVLKLEKRLKIPQDSSAEIISESLLGGKYITIIPGIDDDFIQPNGTIKQTTSAVNFESLISKFMLESGKSSKTDKDDSSSNKEHTSSKVAKEIKDSPSDNNQTSEKDDKPSQRDDE